MPASSPPQSEVRILKDGRVISFCDYGKQDGTTIFQFHGTPGSRIAGYDDQELCEAELRIVTPERPGYGHSTPHPQGSIDSWAFDIQELANQLGINRFHIVGISGGGPFALACAAFMPDRVVSATLISTATPAEHPNFGQGMSMGNRLFFFAARNLQFLLRYLYSAYGWLVLRNRQQSNTGHSHLSEAFFQGGIGLEADLRLVANTWGIPLASISVPVFLWHGEKDVLSPVAGARALASAIPTSEAHFVAGDGHFLFRDPIINKQIFDRILLLTMANE